MRAFIATLDAILAIVLITGVVSGTLFMLENREGVQWDEVYLQRIGTDVLTVLEKTGAVDDYVLSSDTTLIQNVTGMTPNSICIKVSFTEKDTSAPYYSYSKPGCVYGDRQSVAYRQVLVYDEAQVLQKWNIVKAQVWYDE